MFLILRFIVKKYKKMWKRWGMIFGNRIFNIVRLTDVTYKNLPKSTNNYYVSSFFFYFGNIGYVF